MLHEKNALRAPKSLAFQFRFSLPYPSSSDVFDLTNAVIKALVFDPFSL